MNTSKFLIATLLISISSTAAAFGINRPPLNGNWIIHPDVNFPQIDYLVSGSSRVAGVRLNNNGQQRLRCKANFYNGHELIKRRVTTLEPGASRTLATAVWRNRVNIEVSCSPV